MVNKGIKASMEEKVFHKADEQDLKRIIAFICQRKEIDLSSYRQNFLFRRLRIRLYATKSKDSYAYIRILEKDPEELNKFLDALSINVTEFFRDPEVFKSFSKIVLPELMQKKTPVVNQRFIRAWSAGCASGEEPYSLAILFNEEMAGKDNFAIRIYGTDRNIEALDKARDAEYKLQNLKEVDKFLLEKYFINLYNGFYRVKEEIKELVKFKQQNLITDPPLKFMDIIFCRNVMIYLSRKEQETLIKNFYQALKSKGYLVVGMVEGIWTDCREFFTPLDIHRKIYQKAK